MTPIFVEKLYFPRCQGGTGTLPETDIFAEAWWLESMKFGRWMALFSAANFFWVSGRLKEEILPSRGITFLSYGKPPPTYLNLPLPRLQASKIWVNIHRSLLTSTRRCFQGMGMDDLTWRGVTFLEVNIWSPGFCSDFLLLVWKWSKRWVFWMYFQTKPCWVIGRRCGLFIRYT